MVAASRLSPEDLLRDQHKHVAKLSDQASRAARRSAARVMVQLRRDIDRIPGDDFGGWTTATKRAMEMQLNAALQQLKSQTAQALAGVHKKAVMRSYVDAKKWLQWHDRKYLGSATPLRFDVLSYLTEEDQFLINRYQKSLSYWGRRTSDAMRELLQDQVLIGKNWADAAKYLKKNIPALAGKKQWMVERVAATEMAAAYNGTTWKAMMAENTPGNPMNKKLVATFDNRTAADSRALDGQTVPVGQPFTNVDGRSYMYPPNRPRDREIIVGVRPSWGQEADDLLDEIEELDVA